MIEIYQTPTGWRWRIKGKNNEIMAGGEEYKTKYGVYKALGTIEAILESGDEPLEIPLPTPSEGMLAGVVVGRTGGEPLKHDMEYADEQRRVKDQPQA